VTVRQESPTDQRIIAYVVPGGANVPTAGDLRAFLLQKLPDYMVPSAFVLLKELPLTPNGKVDRKALHSADQALSVEQRSVVAARTPVELALAEIWCELLKITTWASTIISSNLAAIRCSPRNSFRASDGSQC